jgi:2-polyprenyl-3-methyl-5-hydroxy-6-metoxy-1,4-benzoquinol methylase
MTDFRSELYDCYVSTFKRHTQFLEDVRGHWLYFEHKYLPLLSSLSKDAAILDIGCGSGLFAAFLVQQGFTQVIGIDISVEQIALAQQRGVQAEVADALPYLAQHTAFYDAIVALDFVEHFTRPELLLLMDALHHALKPGGLLLIQTPNGQGLFPHQIIYGDLTHMTIFNPGSLQQLLELCTFTNIRFAETGPIRHGKKNQLRWFLWQVIKRGANFVRWVETKKQQTIWTENMICLCEKP